MDEFTSKRFKKFAVDFVDEYEGAGRLKAGQMAMERLSEEEYTMSEPFVTQEFKNRGYTFNEPDDRLSEVHPHEPLRPLD
jgi:hypothetical protein